MAAAATTALAAAAAAQDVATSTERVPPSANTRGGVFINADVAPNRCSKARCVALCKESATRPDARFPDWGWENNASCVMPNSPTALVAGGDVALAIKNHGYAVSPRACSPEEANPKQPTAVAALDRKRLKHARFETRQAALVDAYGETFVPRAINNAHGWYDICGQYSALEALDNIAATGANAVRIGWAFDTIDPGGPSEGSPSQAVIGTSPDLLAEVLQRAVELQLIPIVTFNDSTGQVDPTWADKMATKIVSPKYLRLFKAYEPYLLLGIANELNLPMDQFAPAYKSAIRKIRAKGYRGTLVVTANEWGQGCETLLTFGPLIVAEDPAHNVLFDLHMYTYVHYRHASAPNQQAGGEPERLEGCLDEVAKLELPLLVGEFGQNHSSGPVAWQTIVERTNANQQGYAPWLWYGDTEYPQLNMNTTWEGPLSEWGRKATADFASTSRKASVFR